MFDTKECEANRLHNVLTLLKHIICLKGKSLIYIQQALSSWGWNRKIISPPNCLDKRQQKFLQMENIWCIEKIQLE